MTRLTGSTVTRIVASRATISDMKARLIIMSHSFFVGVHSSVIGAFSSPLASTSTIILVFCISSRVTGRTVIAVACLTDASLSLAPTVQALAIRCKGPLEALHIPFSSIEPAYVGIFLKSSVSIGVEARFVDADHASESLCRREVAPVPAGAAMTCSWVTDVWDIWRWR